MPQLNVVVDGSNIATEGRSLPSLSQLDEAVRAFLSEFPDAQVTVVVDATFGHRIDDADVPAFKDAEAAGELVSPPAGAIGRGDAFLLRIAEKIGAMVLSNDSFQEFHGEHDWLFDPDRLIGGKPVPGVGWIFTPRTPVRGPKSREAVKEAKRAKSPAKDEASRDGDRGRGGRGGGRGRGGRKAADELVSEVEAGASAGAGRRGRGRGQAADDGERGGKDRDGVKPKRKKAVETAIEAATEEAVEPAGKGRKRRRRGGGPPAEPLNAPLEFLEFVAAHPLGSNVSGVVESFSSHGCFVEVGPVRCYLPLSGMGDPPPRSAREVLKRGEEVVFTIQAFDPPRRGVELALPQFAHPSGAPTPETVEAEITRDGERRSEDKPERSKKPAKKAAAEKAAKPGKAKPEKDEADKPQSKKAAAKKAAAKKDKSEVEKAGTKKATAKKPAKKAAVKKAAAETVPEKKGAARKAAKTSAAPAKKAAEKKVAAKKVATKKAAPAKKAAAAKKPGTKKAATKKSAGTAKAATKKLPGTAKAAAKRAPAKQAPT